VEHVSTRLRLGVLGAGMIASEQYGFLPNLAPLADRLDLVAIASPDQDKARDVASRFGISAVHPDLEVMLASEDLHAVLNLTPAPVHFETSCLVLEAGKHLISEKPLAGTLAEAAELCRLAESAGLLIVCAPADMLGKPWSQARDLIAAGAIGKPRFARFQSSHAGPAALAWPADPRGFYTKGVGPLADLGIYGLQRAIGLLGPVERVSAFSGVTDPIRVARGGLFDGVEVPVQEPDNNLLLLDFGDSVFASVDATYNVIATKSPLAEIYGSKGVLVVNQHDNPRQIEIFGEEIVPGLSGWIDPQELGFQSGLDAVQEMGRGALVAHLLDCLNSKTKPIADGRNALHLIEIIEAARHSAINGSAVSIGPRAASAPPGVA